MHYHELCLSYLSFMRAPLTLRFSHIGRACLMSSHAEPFFFHHSLIPFLPGGDFPPSVNILHMYPCIEHRYVPLLGTSLFSLNDTHLLLVCNPKASLFFFQAFQITEKVQKNKKTKILDKERCYLLAAVESCRLRTEHCISHPLVGL